MSPNGTLLAYSKPVDIKELRDQAALISIVWKDNCVERHKTPSKTDSGQDTRLRSTLRTLTVETEDCNIIVRFLQPELLLVLVGTIPPNKLQTFKITAEGYGDTRYPEVDVLSSRPGSSSRLLQYEGAGDNSTGFSGERSLAKGKAPSIASNMSQREKDIRTGTLHVQRKRLDALADYVLKDFEDTGFVMPADSDLQ